MSEQVPAKKLTYYHSHGCHAHDGNMCSQRCRARAGFYAAQTLLNAYLKDHRVEVLALAESFAEEDRACVEDGMRRLLESLLE